MTDGASVRALPHILGLVGKQADPSGFAMRTIVFRQPNMRTTPTSARRVAAAVALLGLVHTTEQGFDVSRQGFEVSRDC